MTGYLYRGKPDLLFLNAAILAARKSPRRNPKPGPEGPTHGNGTGLYKRGCRCEPCRKAESRRRKKVNKSTVTNNLTPVSVQRGGQCPAFSAMQQTAN